jgi:hypothetical protein
MMTGPKTVDVELTEEELVKLLAWVAPESRLLPRLKAVTRLEPGCLQQLAHAGSDDAVKLAGVGGHFTRAVSGGGLRTRGGSGMLP